jgi:AraC family transcriptional regulator, alkane utilization regulator
MRSLGKFADPDALSQLLLRLSVTSSLYCLSQMTAPWGFQVGARPIPAFHLLLSGSAWLEVDRAPGLTPLAAGDLVILPRGDGHRVRDSPDSPVLWLDRLLEEHTPAEGQLRYGGGGEPSELLCGGFAVEHVTARPLLEALPTVIHLRGREGRPPEWLTGLVRMVATEMATPGPGREAVVTRLTDALLAQALRHALVNRDPDEPVLPPSLRDPQVARALRLIREHPDEPWTVTKLAAAVSLSRSAFASRFHDATGEAPMRYLTDYRLSRAAAYLRSTDAGLREIARLTGYESEVSISKAFRRRYGCSPGAYRRAATAPT